MAIFLFQNKIQILNCFRIQNKIVFDEQVKQINKMNHLNSCKKNFFLNLDFKNFGF
jgi:hypothetical protein